MNNVATKYLPGRIENVLISNENFFEGFMVAQEILMTNRVINWARIWDKEFGIMHTRYHASYASDDL